MNMSEMNDKIVNSEVVAPQETKNTTGLAASEDVSAQNASVFNAEGYIGSSVFSQIDGSMSKIRADNIKRRLMSAADFVKVLLGQALMNVALAQLRLGMGVIQAATNCRFIRTNCPFAGGNRTWNTVTEFCDVSPYYIYAYSRGDGANPCLQVNSEGRPLLIRYTEPRVINSDKFSAGFQKYAAKIDTSVEARWADIGMVNAMNSGVMAASLAIRLLNTSEFERVEKTAIPYGSTPLCYPAVKLIQLAQTKWPVGAADFWMKRNIPATRYAFDIMTMKAHQRPLEGWRINVKYISAVDYFDNRYGNKSGTANATAFRDWLNNNNPDIIAINSFDMDQRTAKNLLCCYYWDPAGFSYLDLNSDDNLKLQIRRYIDDYRLPREINKTKNLLLVDIVGGVNAGAIPPALTDLAALWNAADPLNIVDQLRPAANADIFAFLGMYDMATVDNLKRYLVNNHGETFNWCVEWIKSRYLGSTPYPFQDYERNLDLSLTAVLPARADGAWANRTFSGYSMNANQLQFVDANRDAWLNNAEFGLCSVGGPEDQSFYNRELGFSGNAPTLPGMNILSNLVELADNLLTTETQMMKKGLLPEANLPLLVDTAIRRFVWFQTSLNANLQSRSLLQLLGNQGITANYQVSLSPMEASGKLVSMFETKAKTGIFEPCTGNLRPTITRDMEYLFMSRQLPVEAAYHVGLVFVDLTVDQWYMTPKEISIPYVSFQFNDTELADERKMARNANYTSTGLQTLTQQVSVFVNGMLNPKIVEKIVRSAGLAQVQQGHVDADFTVAAPRDCIFAYVPNTSLQAGLTRIAYVGNSYIAGRKQYFSNIVGPSGALAITSFVDKTRVDRPTTQIHSWNPIQDFKEEDFGD
jgi:hypothetical protein